MFALAAECEEAAPATATAPIAATAPAVASAKRMLFIVICSSPVKHNPEIKLVRLDVASDVVINDGHYLT